VSAKRQAAGFTCTAGEKRPIDSSASFRGSRRDRRASPPIRLGTVASVQLAQAKIRHPAPAKSRRFAESVPAQRSAKALMSRQLRVARAPGGGVAA